MTLILDDDEGPVQPPKPVHPPPRSRSRSAVSRELPYSEEAEQHVLACMLLDGSDTIVRAQDSQVAPDSFYDPKNRILCREIFDLHTALGTASLETLYQSLKDRNLLEQVGGMPYLIQVTGRIPTTAHAGYFIETVREKAIRRSLIKDATTLVEHCYNGSALDELIQAAESLAPDQAARTDLLKSRAYNHTLRLQKPIPRFQAGGTTISTPGNLTTLYGQAKSAKSSLEAAMLASTMLIPGATNDTLGMSGPNTQCHAVIHIDTEQSPYDWQQMISTILRRAGLDTPPPWFMSFNLTGVSAPECRRLFHQALKLGQRLHGGVHSAFCDGVGDLVIDPNDPAECFPLVTDLHRWAIDFNTSLVNVLHLNPGSEEKGRGHLGSQLLRKSESNILMEKDGEITRYWGTQQRGKMISKANALAFQWSDEAQMHVSTEAGPQKAKGGRPAKYDIATFSDLLPAPGTKPESGAILFRKATQISDIKQTTFRDLLNAAVDDGKLLRTLDKIGFYYVRAY